MSPAVYISQNGSTEALIDAWNQQSCDMLRTTHVPTTEIGADKTVPASPSGDVAYVGQ